MVNTALFEHGRLWTAIDKMRAIFARDRRIALSYTAYFWLRWVTIGVEVSIAFFLSLLIAPSARFGFGGHVASYFDYLVVSFAFVQFQTVALASFADAVRDGQTLGTLEVILATPTSLPLIVLSSGLWAFTLTSLEVVAYFGFAMVYGLHLWQLNPTTMFCFLLLTIVSVSPIGVLAAAATMTFKKTGPITFFMTSAANLFGGVYIPVSKLPLALQYVGWCLPITHALNGFRGALYGARIIDLAPDALWLAVSTLVLLPTSLYLFARAVRRSKIDGTLGHY